MKKKIMYLIMVLGIFLVLGGCNNVPKHYQDIPKVGISDYLSDLSYEKISGMEFEKQEDTEISFTGEDILIQYNLDKTFYYAEFYDFPKEIYEDLYEECKLESQEFLEENGIEKQINKIWYDENYIYEYNYLNLTDSEEIILEVYPMTEEVNDTLLDMGYVYFDGIYYMELGYATSMITIEEDKIAIVIHKSQFFDGYEYIRDFLRFYDFEFVMDFLEKDAYYSKEFTIEKSLNDLDFIEYVNIDLLF